MLFEFDDSDSFATYNFPDTFFNFRFVMFYEDFKEL